MGKIAKPKPSGVIEIETGPPRPGLSAFLFKVDGKTYRCERCRKPLWFTVELVWRAPGGKELPYVGLMRCGCPCQVKAPPKKKPTPKKG